MSIALTAITTAGCGGATTDDFDVARMLELGDAYDTVYVTGYDTGYDTSPGTSSATGYDTSPQTSYDTGYDTTVVTSTTSGGTDSDSSDGSSTTWGDSVGATGGTTWGDSGGDSVGDTGGTTWGDSVGGTGGTTWGESENPSTGDEPEPSPTSGAGSEGTDATGYDTGPDDASATGTDGGGTNGGDTGGGDTDGGDTDGGDTAGGDTGGGDTGGGDDGGGGACANHWVRAPRATGTAHIEGFNPLTAANTMLGQDPWMTAAAVPLVGNDYANALRLLIAGLALSANVTPPASFNKNAYGNKWGPWKNSKEYRGFLDLFPYKIYCDSATNTLAKKAGAMAGTTADYHEDASLQMSHGYTKLPGAFQAGEPHGTTPTVNRMSFGDRAGAKTDRCLTHTGYFAARIGAAERAAAFPILFYDAPFIWQRVESTVCCDGTYEVHFNGSHFPTQSLYLNFDRTIIRWQNNLAQFIISGGVTLNAVGVGLMAAAGVAVNRQGNGKKIDACNGAITQQYTPNPSINANMLP